MNNLSWLIYLADVLPNLADVLGFITLMGVIASSFLYLVWFGGYAEGNNSKPKGHIPVALFLGFLLLVSIAIPSKDTMYLIAASEVGEIVVASEDGQKVLNDLKEVLDHQLEKLKTD